MFRRFGVPCGCKMWDCSSYMVLLVFFLCGGKWAMMRSVLNMPLFWSKYRDNDNP